MLLRKLLALLILLMLVLAGNVWAEKSTLALFNLRPTNMEAMGSSSDVLFGLIYALENQKSVEVMPRREMEETLFQKGLVQSDNPDAVIKAGKALGVKHVLFGQVTRTGSRILTSLKMMDIRASKIVENWDHTFSSREAIVPEISVFSEQLAATLAASPENVEPDPAELLPVGPDVEIGNLRATGHGKAIQLSWEFDPTEPIIGFHVYRANKADGPYQFLGKVLKNRFEDLTSQKGLSYHYRVGILTASGHEVKSDLTAEIVNTGEKVPHPPHIMDGQGHVQRTSFKFVPSLQNDQDGIKVASYRIYRRQKQTKASKWEKIKTIDAGSNSQFKLAIDFEDKEGLEDGGNYEYAISSLDRKKRESIYSDTISLSTIAKPVLRLKEDDLLRTIKLEWEPVAGEGIKGYRIYRKSDDSQWKKLSVVLSAKKTELVDKQGLDDGTSYSYYLTVYDNKQEGAPSNVITGKTKDLPTAPEDLTGQSGLVKSVLLKWTAKADPDVGGYHIYRGESLDDLASVTKLRDHKANQYLDNGAVFSPLKDGREYYYVVASFNTLNAEGIATVPVSATTKFRPQAPENFTAVAASDRIRIRWQANAEADIKENLLYRSRNGGAWVKTAELQPAATEYNDLDLVPEASYRYRLVAVDKDALKSDPVETGGVLSPLEKPEKE